MKLSLKDYQGVHFSFNILALYLNRLLIQLGFGVVGIFQVIYLFEKLGSSLPIITLLYSVIFFLVVILTPVSAQFLSLVGMKTLMILAMPFAFGSILAMYLWDLYPLYAAIGLICSSVVYKVLYWVPYHVDFATFGDKKTRGRQMSILLAVSEMIAIITPFIGGIVIASSGFSNLFLTSLGILLFAIIPLFFIDDRREHYSYSYLGTYKELLSKENRGLLLGYMGDGAQLVVTATVWPIFIFLLLKGEFLMVGAISSITILVIIALRFIVGDLIDKYGKHKILFAGSILNMTGWIVKFFIETAFQIFLVDTYHKMGRAVNRLSIDVTTYDQAIDNGHYIDEFTVLKEMSINIGRIVGLGCIGLIVSFFSLKFAFIIAALASLFVTFLNRSMELDD